MKTSKCSFDEGCRFLIKLGEAAHAYGCNATRLELFLTRLSVTLGFGGVFRSTPTEIVFAFQEDPERPQRTHLSSVPGAGLELSRLAEVGELVDAVVGGQVSVPDAMVRLDEIEKIPHPWGAVASAASYVVVGFGFAVLLSGGWWDVGLASLFSAVVFGMVTLAGRCGTWAVAWLPISTAFVAGILAAAARILVPESNLVLVALSAILILIPGYPISVGIIELVNNHVVSGLANLTNGLVYLAKQFVGAWLGVRLVAMACSVPEAVAAAPVEPGWLWLAVPLLILGLCVAFQTALRDFGWAALVCAAAYGGILLGSSLDGGNLGNLFGTIAAVVLANLWARAWRRPTSIVLLPAIVLLVSGSIGFRGLAALAVGQVAVGTEQLVQMLVVALTIAAGLLVGNTIIRPRVTL